MDLVSSPDFRTREIKQHCFLKRIKYIFSRVGQKTNNNCGRQRITKDEEKRREERERRSGLWRKATIIDSETSAELILSLIAMCLAHVSSATARHGTTAGHSDHLRPPLYRSR